MAMGSALVDQYASKPIMSREDYCGGLIKLDRKMA